MHRRLLLAEESLQDLIASHDVSALDLSHDGRERAYAKTVVQRNGQMVRAVGRFTRQSKMGPRLTNVAIAEPPQGARELRARERARELHDASTSSRTK